PLYPLHRAGWLGLVLVGAVVFGVHEFAVTFDETLGRAWALVCALTAAYAVLTPLLLRGWYRGELVSGAPYRARAMNHPSVYKRPGFPSEDSTHPVAVEVSP